MKNGQILILATAVIFAASGITQAKDIVHDAEY
jgi:hypothetical protein